VAKKYSGCLPCDQLKFILMDGDDVIGFDLEYGGANSKFNLHSLFEVQIAVVHLISKI